MVLELYEFDRTMGFQARRKLSSDGLGRPSYMTTPAALSASPKGVTYRTLHAECHRSGGLEGNRPATGNTASLGTPCALNQ